MRLTAKHVAHVPPGPLHEQDYQAIRMVDGTVKLTDASGTTWWYRGFCIERGTAPNGYWGSWQVLGKGMGGCSSLAEAKRMIDARLG